MEPSEYGNQGVAFDSDAPLSVPTTDCKALPFKDFDYTPTKGQMVGRRERPTVSHILTVMAVPSPTIPQGYPLRTKKQARSVVRLITKLAPSHLGS